MQLDIFEHSRDVMLRNDVLLALEQHDATRARAACQTLHQEYAQDESLPALLTLTDAVEARARQLLPQTLFADHSALRRARLALQDTVEPAALRLLGQNGAARWLRPFWQELAQRCTHLPFRTEFEQDHAAPELAWFPAWLLTARPALMAQLAQAQVSLHSAPEQALRLLVNLLGLERQGRHHDIVQLRRNLRDLNAWLYGAYMKTR